ncbi:MAG: hypothetical protein ACI4YB_09250 [Oscillospiraceae bacterium]
MKKVSVVLTKYTDRMSNILYMLYGFGYTHASISLDEELGEMYSFNYRGFCIETVKKHRRRGVERSASFTLRISDESYERLKDEIGRFIENRPDYKYTRFGVLMCLLKIPFKRKNHYFCSQFVAEMLSITGAVKLKKSPSLYLPNNIWSEIGQTEQLESVKYNFI